MAFGWRERLQTIAVTVLLTSAVWLIGAFVFFGRQAERQAPPAQFLAAVEEPETGVLVVPVDGVRRDQLVDTWGQSREGGARTHEAIDIVAPRGTAVRAAAGGTVEKLFNSLRGGKTIYVRLPDRRTLHYYAHLDRYASGLAERDRVRAGEVIAYVGSTGDARPDAPHLHFAIERVQPEDGWWQGRAINPYPLLR